MTADQAVNWKNSNWLPSGQPSDRPAAQAVPGELQGVARGDERVVRRALRRPTAAQKGERAQHEARRGSSPPRPRARCDR